MPNLGYMTVQFVHLLALALWIGGTAAVAWIAAPTIFRAIPERSRAGSLMGEILGKLDQTKYVCSIALVVTSLLKFYNWERNWNIWFATRYLAIAVMVITALWAGSVVGPEIQRLRGQRVEGEELSGGDAGRFERLHRLSVALMMVGASAALVALALS